ncbi:MAG: helix-turn-helix transcriptional regulator [Bacteroidales bacterium]|nr:helix-turn-helix transcriptional regulator [Bacteroidales bacterium]
MKERLITFLNKEGITASVFADKIGVQRSAVSHILSGRNNPSYDFIAKILEKYPLLNANWLITGQGETYNNYPAKSEQVNIPGNLLFDQLVENKQNIGNKTLKNSNSGNSVTLDENKEALKEFTDVNKTDIIVFFYKNGSFKEYHPDK